MTSIKIGENIKLAPFETQKYKRELKEKEI